MAAFWIIFFYLDSGRFICTYCGFCANRSRIRWIQHMYDFHTGELNLILEKIRILNNAVAQIGNSSDDEIMVINRLNDKSSLLFLINRQMKVSNWSKKMNSTIKFKYPQIRLISLTYWHSRLISSKKNHCWITLPFDEYVRSFLSSDLFTVEWLIVIVQSVSLGHK